MPLDQTLFGLYSLNFFTNAANSILAPFYPDIAIKKGIKTNVIGYVFSSHPVFSFLFSLLIGKMMKSWGRKKILILGLLLQSIGLAIFGAVIHIEDKVAFVLISALARIIQGIGFACYGSIAYAYLPLLYPDTLEKNISYMEILTGVGLMLGPLIGGALYSLGGYECPFYFMAVFFFFITPIMLGRLPKDEMEKVKDEDKGIEKKINSISVCNFFFNREMFMTFLIVVIPNAAFGVLQPTFTNHMHLYTNNTMVISIMFSVGTFAYAFSMPIMSIIPKSYDRRLWLMVGMLLTSISGFLLGPETLLGFPQSIVFVILGMGILGVGCAFSMVPSIPQFMTLGNKLYPNEKEAIGDMSSGLFTSAYSGGALIGPIAGGYLDSYFGFARGESLLGLMILGYLILFMTLGGGYNAFASLKKAKEEKVRLLEEEEEKNSEEEGKKEKENGSSSYSSPEINDKKTSIAISINEAKATEISTKYSENDGLSEDATIIGEGKSLVFLKEDHDQNQFNTVVVVDGKENGDGKFEENSLIVN